MEANSFRSCWCNLFTVDPGVFRSTLGWIECYVQWVKYGKSERILVKKRCGVELGYEEMSRQKSTVVPRKEIVRCYECCFWSNNV